jgi:toxin YoeB
MEQYTIVIEETALSDFSFWKKSGQKAAVKRIERIIKELSQTPFIGIGNPHALKYELAGKWSRDIDKKNRMVYMVNENPKIVFILSALGHYDDK